MNPWQDARIAGKGSAMPLPHAFGPNHDNVERFIRDLDSIPWLTRVGAAAEGEDADYVDFHFLAKHYTDPWILWGENLASSETRFERLEVEHQRLGAHDAIQEALRTKRYLDKSSTLDDLLARVDREFTDPESGYYGHGDSYMHPHELIEFPARLVRGAALEVMVADLDSSPGLFGHIMQWFQRGRWPAGWSGKFPEGKALIW
jgi:hypothetical protein